MTGFRFLLPAEEEMTEAAMFYENQSVGLGADFLDDVERTIRNILMNPQSGIPLNTGLQRVLTRRFPFSIIYHIEANEVLVVAVAHQKRKPGYWRDR